MKKFLPILFALLLPFTASAHGPSPQKVTETITIKAPPAKVWALLSDFNGMPKWHPAVKSSKVESKGGSTFRLLTLKDGGTIYERLKDKNDADMRLKYEIVEGVLPVSDYYAAITEAGRQCQRIDSGVDGAALPQVQTQPTHSCRPG